MCPDEQFAYISSACAGLAGSRLPFPAAELRRSARGSVCPATRAELFPDRLPSWAAPSKPVFSGFSIGSRRTAAPSGGPDWLSSEGGDAESDWTAGPSASSAAGWEEEEGSVRMFLEITRMTEEYIGVTLSICGIKRTTTHHMTIHYQPM